MLKKITQPFPGLSEKIFYSHLTEIFLTFYMKHISQRAGMMPTITTFSEAEKGC